MTQRSAAAEGDAARAASLRDFRRIPGVGRSIAIDLWDLGYRSVAELRGQDPEAMYARFNLLRGVVVDRCMLYVLRCAVYFASHDEHDPELLKWWSWKEGTAAYPGDGFAVGASARGSD